MEPNDTLLTATQTNINANDIGEFLFSGEIGDNPDVKATDDVDLYALELTESTRVTFDINTSETGSSLDPFLRIFDAEGNELASDFANPVAFIGFQPPSAGTYYAGVSSSFNANYNPDEAGSGTDGNSTGEFNLAITASEFDADEFGGGTQLLKNINADFWNASNFTEVDGQLFFTAEDGITGNELWVSNGTDDGTQLVKDINTTIGNNPNYPSGSYASNFAEFDGQLFFAANDGITGRELWVSDGTADGTQLLVNIDADANYPSGSNVSNFIEFDGQLFFTANDDIVGKELWVSDGTADGTQLLVDINTTKSRYDYDYDYDYDAGSYASNFTEFDGQLFFTASDGITGNELWVSDGTAEGTQLVKDINTTKSRFDYYASGSYASNFTEFDGQLFFTASDGTTGKELWVSDGTAEGTQLVKDINTTTSDDPNYPSGSNASNFTEVDGQLFFTANDGITGRELWVSDGTAEGTQLLKDINTTGSSNASNFTEFDGQLFFIANDGTTGNELWISDGTAEGTQLVKDINAGNSNYSYSSVSYNLTVAGDLLFFTADDGFNGSELWVSDGTTKGTQLFQDINPSFDGSYDGSYPSNLTVVGDQLFFTADTINELWVVSIPDNVIVGDKNKNVLSGTAGVDLINGLGGNDIIRGRGDNDILNGGSGDDALFGNRGNDTIKGGADNDRIFGDQGNDNLRGNAGDDRISGGIGNDSLYGSLGNDRLVGRSGADILTGGKGNDILIGNRGADTFQFEADLLDGVADTDAIERFQSQDSLDFTAYLEAGGSIETTRVSTRLLRIELSGEDIVNVFGNSSALDAAESQL